ncbi:UDP-N-acetylmuramate--L-alanine ligase [Sediminitomix flava]|uniref:UDP-N-acetylmuramate: L-alanyl-gamma-D-glutamyl-meso-diaminopimelate ligase n=1 Tax=Sediminitomix flava TaxID=379075 RepID=A0A315Z765_SEDFL|nr:Mur ligase family protein [Sediminitomix flava]PWJ38615.1 UDP-N-acetylmuramate: L-alanyl-gamma-D-glutamyl-meso-diaminopimelate ligase [Sediminitomix flava]
MRVHLIAIGGSVMHNMAIALKEKGYEVSGSDDLIFEPSKSRLKENGLLPEKEGWNPEIITEDIDAIILGMHAKADNPELKKAQELGLNIYSYPEYIYENSKFKHRVVIAGSHGKTTVSSMIVHVLNYWNIDADYLIGAKVKGLKSSFKLTKEAPILIVEGDEYLSSALDPNPKFIHYHQHIGVVTGIAWDHINVYPEYDGYVHQFKRFIESTPKGGVILYDETDKELCDQIEKSEVYFDVEKIPYNQAKHKIKNGTTELTFGKGKTAIKVFGEHNLKNIEVARHVCERLGVKEDRFKEAIASFEGAHMRMQHLHSSDSTRVYRDFAHAPSKVKATVEAFDNQFPEDTFALLELHTYSSLNKDFLSEYKGALGNVKEAVVFFNPDIIANKGLKEITKEDVANAFDHSNLKVITNSDELKEHLNQVNWNAKNLLIMTSGNLGNIDLEELAKDIAK